MADKRKRSAPTIDLKATEVPASKPELKPAAESAAAPEPASRSPPPQQPRAAEASPPHDFIKTIAMPLAAGFAGALLGGAAIWGLSPRSSNDGGQIAALRKQVQELQNRPAPSASDTQTIDALRARIGKTEQDIANLPPGDKMVAERLTAADGAMKSLGIALGALNKRADDAAANAKQAEDRAAAAEKAVGELRDSVQSASKQQQASATDKAARLALGTAALRDAVVRGAHYKNELAQVKALGATDASIAPLASFAATGVPTAQMLARELNALIPALVKAADVQDAPSGFLERLQANASKLVRINPVDTPHGDKPADALAALEIAAVHADIASALAAIGKLPDKARQLAAEWVAKAAARETAIAAARGVAADTARGLSSGLAK